MYPSHSAKPTYSLQDRSRKICMTYPSLPAYMTALKQRTYIRTGTQDQEVRCCLPKYNPNSCYHYDAVHVDNEGGGNYISALVDFAAFPTGYSVASALLYVYIPNVTGLISYYIKRITEVWGTCSRTWNNRPAMTGVRDSGTLNAQIGWNTLTITNTVKDWIESGAAQYGIYFDSEYVPEAEPMLEFWGQLHFSLLPYIVATINI